MRFIDPALERETHILYNKYANKLTSYNIQVFKDKQQEVLADQQFDGADYLVGTNSVFMIRSFSLSRNVQIFVTDPRDKYNFATLESKTMITDFYSTETANNREKEENGLGRKNNDEGLAAPDNSNFCPISA